PSEIYTLSLHDALPIYRREGAARARDRISAQLQPDLPIRARGRDEDRRPRRRVPRAARVAPQRELAPQGRSAVEGLRRVEVGIRSEEHTSELQSRSDLV